MHSAEDREENALNRELKKRSKRSTYSVFSSVFVTLTKIQDIDNGYFLQYTSKTTYPHKHNDVSV